MCCANKAAIDEAIAHHRAAVELQPQSPLAHNSLGLSLANAGRHDEAMPHYTRAIALQPGWSTPTSTSRCRMLARGQTDEALARHDAQFRASAKRRRTGQLFVRLVIGLPIDADNEPLRGFADARAGGRLERAGFLLAAAIALILPQPGAAR